MPKLKAQRPRIAPVAQLVTVDDLSGGLELRVDPTLLKPHQSRLLRNFALREPGALPILPGWETFSTTSLGNRRIQGGHRIYLANQNPFTLASDDGDVYKPSDGGVWGAAVETTRHATNEHHFVHDRDLVAVFDGDTAPVKSTDGSTWTQMGISAPSVAPSASAVAGGSLVDGNTYEVSYAYQDDGLMHPGSESATDTQAVSGGNLTVRVAVTASADPQVDKIILYVRDVTAGETVRRKYAEYANTTTNRDITANTWGQGEEAKSDNGLPSPTLVAGLVWKNRWWGWVGNRLYFTQIFEPQSWGAFFYIDLPFERGDTIAAGAAQGDTLVLWGQSSQAFLVIGQTSLDFEVRPALGSQAGAFGPRAVKLIENGVIHAAAEGVYIFDGASDRLLSYNIDPGWRDLITASTASNLAKIAVVYHGLTKEVRIAVPRLYPWGEPGEWILDLNRTRTQETPAWTSSDRAIGGYINFDGNEPTTGNRGRLFSWGLTTAELFEENTGTTADGDPMVADCEFSTHTMGGYVAIFSDGYLEVRPSSGALTITPIVDGAGVGSQTVSIGTGLVPYGDPSALYGDASRLYGGKGRAFVPFEFPMEAEGRNLALRARYTGTFPFKWFTYGLMLTPEPALSGI
jgi:hypothetical protein